MGKVGWPEGQRARRRVWFGGVSVAVAAVIAGGVSIFWPTSHPRATRVDPDRPLVCGPRLVGAFDTATGRLLAKIPVGVEPHGLCVWPQPGRYSLGHTGITR